MVFTIRRPAGMANCDYFAVDDLFEILPQLEEALAAGRLKQVRVAQIREAEMSGAIGQSGQLVGSRRAAAAIWKLRNRRQGTRIYP